MTPQSLQEQVAAARSGSREAFASLVGHYQGLVSATTLNMVGDFQQSEDIAQEAFLIAWNRLTELSDPAKFPAWVCGIARNCSKNWLRRQGRNPLAKSTELTDITSRERCSRTEDDAQLVWQSLADIPEAYREPMLMFYRHGAAISEIAAALELSEEAVRQRLSRGRKLLKSEVERTVEKTLRLTRPDTAFTLAVLAAIPLSASVGCSATSKSIGFYGGIAAMSSYGILGFILAAGIMLLLQIGPAVLFAAVFFYSFWYAVKNSPTLQTRRFVIGAMLDLSVLIWVVVPLIRCVYHIFMIYGPKHSNDLVYIVRMLPSALRDTLFDHLPVFLLFSAFAVYVVLRWRELLAQDQADRHPRAGGDLDEKATCSVASEIHVAQQDSVQEDNQAESLGPRLRGDDGGETSPFAKTFEAETTFFRNLSNYVLSPNGLCVKRNIMFGVLAVMFIITATQNFRLTWIIAHQFGWNPTQTVIGWVWFGYGTGQLIALAVLLFLAWIASKAITISWDETAMEKTPPRVPLSDWSVEENRPAIRRQILWDSFFLLLTVPLALIGFGLAAGLVHQHLFTFRPLQLGKLNTLTEWTTALAVLTALWISRNPSKRLLGISRLFLVAGLSAALYIEGWPLLTLAGDFYGQTLSGTLGLPMAPPHGTYEMQKEFFSFHLTAAAFLVYSLLASAFCFFLQPAEISQRSPEA